MLFPSVSVPGELTRIALSDVHAGDDLPNVNALLSTDDPTAYADAPESTPRAVPLLTEHALNTFTRPGLRGFRITVDDAEDEASAADFAALMQLGGGWTHDSPSRKNPKSAIVGWHIALSMSPQDSNSALNSNPWLVVLCAYGTR